MRGGRGGVGYRNEGDLEGLGLGIFLLDKMMPSK